MNPRWAPGLGAALSVVVMQTALAAELRTGPWGGSYECAQGSTSAILTLDRIDPGDGLSRVNATFKFGGGPRPSGSYTLQGTFDPRSRELTLKPVAWLNRPGNYVAVGFNGVINEELTRFAGKMDFHLCGDIRLMSLTRHPTSSPATAQAAPAPPVATATVPPLAETGAVAAGTSRYDVRRPPTVEQFKQLSEEERIAYRESVLALTRDAYMALPFETKLRAAELTKADAVLALHGATKALGAVDRKAQVDPDLGATPEARQTALDQAKAEVDRWMKLHPMNDPERDSNAAFVAFLKTQTSLTRPQMLTAIDVRSHRQVVLNLTDAMVSAQKSYDSLIAIREREKATRP